MVEKYPFSYRGNDLVLFLIALSLVLIPIFIIPIDKFHPLVLIFPFIGILSGLLVVLKFGKAAITLSEDGLHIHFLLQFINFIGISSFAKNVPRFLRWDEIIGITILESSPDSFYNNRKSKFAKIFFKNKGNQANVLLLDFEVVNKSQELFDCLSNKIPKITNKNAVLSDIFKNITLPQKIDYQNWTLTSEGIRHANEIIAWNSIKQIYLDDIVSGAVNIKYLRQSTNLERLTIHPSGILHLHNFKDIEQFRNFLRYLIKQANDAAIDPSLIKLFNKSYGREKNYYHCLLSSPYFLCYT